MNNAEYLSREGLDKIKNELQELTTVGRKNIASRLEYAKSLGDLSENSEYKEALESQRFLEEKIARATISSLKAHKSSRLPPPRPTIKTSAPPNAFISWMARAICPAAERPCT